MSLGGRAWVVAAAVAAAAVAGALYSVYGTRSCENGQRADRCHA